MALRIRLILTIGPLLAAALLAGCGSQSSIRGALSQSSNTALSGDLSAVSNAVNIESCGAARTALSKLDVTVSALPSSTNAQLVANLKQGATTLRGLALTDCRGTRTTSSSSSSSTTSSTTTTTTTSSTATAPPATTQTQTQTQTETNTLPGTGTVTTFQSQPTQTSANGGGSLGSGG